MLGHNDRSYLRSQQSRLPAHSLPRRSRSRICEEISRGPWACRLLEAEYPAQGDARVSANDLGPANRFDPSACHASSTAEPLTTFPIGSGATDALVALAALSCGERERIQLPVGLAKDIQQAKSGEAQTAILTTTLHSYHRYRWRSRRGKAKSISSSLARTWISCHQADFSCARGLDAPPCHGDNLVATCAKGSSTGQ
jgi:hypothetical protein